MLSAVDWLPRLRLWSGRARVPTDRPDRRSRCAFFLGDSSTTGRDHVIYFGPDAEMMAVKWRTMKVVFRYSESNSGPIFKPQWPMVFDLIKTRSSTGSVDLRLDCAWVFYPVFERLGVFQQSVASYPNSLPDRNFSATRESAVATQLPTWDERPAHRCLEIDEFRASRKSCRTTWWTSLKATINLGTRHMRLANSGPTRPAPQVSGHGRWQRLTFAHAAADR